MSLHRRNPKRDASEAEIVDALRVMGFSVRHLSAKGCPDLLVGKDGITRVMEVKTGDKSLSSDQQEWWKTWRGNDLLVLRHVEDAAVIAAGWHGTDLPLTGCLWSAQQRRLIAARLERTSRRGVRRRKPSQAAEPGKPKSEETEIVK